MILRHFDRTEQIQQDVTSYVFRDIPQCPAEVFANEKGTAGAETCVGMDIFAENITERALEAMILFPACYCAVGNGMAFGEATLAAGFLMVATVRGRLSLLEYKQTADAAFVE